MQLLFIIIYSFFTDKMNETGLYRQRIIFNLSFIKTIKQIEFQILPQFKINLHLYKHFIVCFLKLRRLIVSSSSWLMWAYINDLPLQLTFKTVHPDGQLICLHSTVASSSRLLRLLLFNKLLSLGNFPMEN